MSANLVQFAAATIRRMLPAVIAACALTFMPGVTQAGIFVGEGSGNDGHDEVLDVIETYNAANDPDLPVDFELFKKTDSDADFVFDPSNGFEFFSDAAGTMPITSADDLHELNTAYFTYTGNLLYYSVKGGNNFNLYTFMAGINEMVAPDNAGGQPAAISHVSFWVPEPSSFVLMLGAMVAAIGARRRGSRVC